jgi:serine protease Do
MPPATAQYRVVIMVLAILLSGCAANARGMPDSFAPLVRRVLPAVVNIAVTESVSGRDMLRNLPPELRDSPLGRQFRRQLEKHPEHTIGAGSGFIIDPSGFIVTNNHVVGHAERIVVSMSDGARFPARLVGQDPLTDIAVIKINAGKALPAVTWGDSRRMEVGDWILSAGNPFGLGGSVTAGIISAEGRDLGSGPFDNFIQLDAPINPGNSGGPVFNMDGQVIGVSSVIVSPTGASVGIGFAIPSATVYPVVQQLISHGSIARGWLGVSVEDGDGGVLIAGMDRGGPADRAGMRAGDVVLAVNGKQIRTARGLIRAVAGETPGVEARVTVLRDGRRLELPIAVGQRPAMNDQ